MEKFFHNQKFINKALQKNFLFMGKIRSSRNDSHIEWFFETTPE